MIESYRHKRSKQRLIQYFFRFFQTCSDKGHFRSTMDIRIELMGHMAVGDSRGDEYKYYSSYGSDRHHDCHRYHPYRRNDRGYLPDDSRK